MFGAPTPILRSFDEQRTKRFYLDFLGFEVEFEHRFEPDMPLYLGVRKDDCRLHLSEHYGDAAPGARVRIPVEDIHDYVRSLSDRRFENARPGAPQLMDWGDWELTVHDPSSNRLTFFKTADR